MEGHYSYKSALQMQIIISWIIYNIYYFNNKHLNNNYYIIML